jgi:electron transport complex protein RnfG
MKKDFVFPIAVLTVICLVISAALAITNNFTAPVITAAAEQRASEARSAVIPDADGFEQIDITALTSGSAEFPISVKGIYHSTNDKGYVFMMTVQGYGGDLEIICGIDEDGSIIAAKTLSAANETKGMGTKVTEPGFESQFPGKTASDSFDTIAGATISSKAYVGAIKDAFAAYGLVKN